jgi:hypothetical protein
MHRMAGGFGEASIQQYNIQLVAASLPNTSGEA